MEIGIRWNILSSLVDYNLYIIVQNVRVHDFRYLFDSPWIMEWALPRSIGIKEHRLNRGI